MPVSVVRYRCLRGLKGTPFCGARTLIKSFELRTHKRLIDIHEANARTVEVLNRLVVPAGVFVKIKA
jgi:small subunit ribosomal protein S10